MERAVKRDLKARGDLGDRATLAALALVMAQAIDRQGDTGAPTAVAKLVQELRAVMAALRGGNSDGDDDPDFTAAMSTPVRDAPVA